jgi:hypothetical protein
LDCGREKSYKGLYCKFCGYKHRKKVGFKKGHPVFSGVEKGWFKKGVGTFKGKKHSEETKKLFSEQRSGKRFSIKSEFKKGQNPWNKGIKYLKIKGKNHWNWKGGISSLRVTIHNLFESKQWRSGIFKRDNYTCVLCGAKSGNGKAVYLEADHYPKPFFIIRDEYNIRNKEDALNCEELWDLNNGRTLCKKCHLNTLKYVQKYGK